MNIKYTTTAWIVLLGRALCANEYSDDPIDYGDRSKIEDYACCGYYPPAFSSTQCSWGFFTTLDFLYWYGRESGLSYAALAKVVSIPDPTGANSPNFIGVHKAYKHFDTNWEPGVRLGLGWNGGDDGWELLIQWSYYTNQKKASTSVAPFELYPNAGGSVLINPWTDRGILAITSSADATGAISSIYQSVTAHWLLRFHQLDLDFGRKYWLSPCFTMLPYVGLRGAWTDARFKVSGELRESLTSSEIEVQTSDRFKNQNWGTGLLAGFQPTIYFIEDLSLFANVDAALLWGNLKHTINRSYINANSSFEQVISAGGGEDAYFGMQPVLDLSLGLRWEKTWCEKRYGLLLDAGWEHHIWFDYIHRMQLDASASIVPAELSASPMAPPDSEGFFFSPSYQEVLSRLNMGGFVFRARFDF